MHDASMLEAAKKEGQADWPALSYQAQLMRLVIGDRDT
jgi:hypothetical protein